MTGQHGDAPPDEYVEAAIQSMLVEDPSVQLRIRPAAGIGGLGRSGFELRGGSAHVRTVLLRPSAQFCERCFQ